MSGTWTILHVGDPGEEGRDVARAVLSDRAKLIRQQMETSYDVISIHRQAARADPTFAAEYRKVLDGRANTFAEFIDGLRGGLGPGVDTRTATDVLWAFSNEELYGELVKERGWSHDRYEQWLARTLITQLIEYPPPLRDHDTGPGR